MSGIATEWWILYILIFISASFIDYSIRNNRSTQAKDQEQFTVFGQSVHEQNLLTKFFENIYKPYSLEDLDKIDGQWAMEREDNPPSLYDVMDVLSQIRDGENYCGEYHSELISQLEEISGKLTKISETLSKSTIPAAQDSTIGNG
jgi:hypothetical protein